MKYGIFSANEWIYPDTDLNGAKSEIKLFAAQNSYANAQFLCETESDLKIEWENIDNSSISAPQIFQLIPVYVDKNTGVGSNCVVPQGTTLDYPSRLAPFDIYDAMKPIDNTAEYMAFGKIALYFRWPTKNIEKGCYKGTLKITNSDSVTVLIPCEINVTNAYIPDNETLRLTNWYNFKNLPEYHGVEKDSEEYWQIIKTYGERMRECHQTDFWIPNDFIIAKKDENGKFTFDFSRAEKLIRLYLSLGFRFIEGPMMLHRKSWESKEFYITINGEDVLVTSNEGYAYIKELFTTLYNFLKINGWLEIFAAHVGDEPCKHCEDNYRIVACMIRKFMPGVKIIEAVETPDLDGAVDIWVPKSIVYENHKEAFDLKQKNGDTLWFYTCCFPGGFYLNRLLDQELIRTRYLHWANFVYGFTGYLHWGLNMYKSNGGNDVFKHSSNRVDKIVAQVLPAGDTHILYPNGLDVMRSVRFEMMRSGCEDYELLKLIEAKDPKKADNIAKKCVRTFTDYTKDIEIFENAQKEMLEWF